VESGSIDEDDLELEPEEDLDEAVEALNTAYPNRLDAVRNGKLLLSGAFFQGGGAAIIVGGRVIRSVEEIRELLTGAMQEDGKSDTDIEQALIAIMPAMEMMMKITEKAPKEN